MVNRKLNNGSAKVMVFIICEIQSCYYLQPPNPQKGLLFRIPITNRVTDGNTTFQTECFQTFLGFEPATLQTFIVQLDIVLASLLKRNP